MDNEHTDPAPALRPLKNPTYRAMWLAGIVSNFGGLIQAVGAAWLMTSISDSANMVALVQASTTLPIMLLYRQTEPPLTFLGFAVCAGVTGLSASALLKGAALMIGGACWVLTLSLFNVTVQLSTPRWVVGRALALYQTAVFGGMALGSWLWGYVAETASAETALVAAAAAMLAGSAIGLFLPLPDRAELNLDPLNRWKEPHVAFDVQPRSGPVTITIEYLIREADTAAFLEVMAARRRMRRRDGARHWHLLRDLETPTLWAESYQTPTWLDYIRHNRRATQADAAIGDRLRALHSGPEPPRVRRMIVRQIAPAHLDPAPKAAMEVH